MQFLDFFCQNCQTFDRPLINQLLNYQNSKPTFGIAMSSAFRGTGVQMCVLTEAILYVEFYNDTKIKGMSHVLVIRTELLEE